MMRTDSNSSDHSPPLSDNTGGSWVHSWDNEDSSISGLNFDTGSNRELSRLVEDKEVAARAVAFVVNSTRKGIVPLCADVATLLRNKKKLENKILRLKNENEALRHASNLAFQTSQSASPAPHSIHSYSDRGSIQDPAVNTEENGRPCSRCSHCSSALGTSPKFERKRLDQHSNLMSAFTAHPNSNNSQQFTYAVVHSAFNNPRTELPQNVAATSDDEKLSRKNSLPEIVSEPSASVPKVRPSLQRQSTETQCDLDEKKVTENGLEERFLQTVSINQQLTEQLSTAQQEIELLKQRLKLIQDHQTPNLPKEQYHVENECDTAPPVGGSTEPSSADPSEVLPVLSDPENTERECPTVSKPPIILPSPLAGCKCCKCTRESGEFTMRKSHRGSHPLQEETSFCKMPAEIGSHVTAKGGHAGHVRYLGHIDGMGPQNTVYAGLELDTPGGRQDGCHNDKRYFSCKKDHACFIPVNDIISVTKREGEKKVCSPMTSAVKTSDACSSSSGSESCGKIPKRDKYEKSKIHKKYKKNSLKLQKESGVIQGDLV